MSMKIVCITGLMGSGKNEVASHIAQKYGYHLVDYADMLREICRKEGFEVTRDNLQNLRVKYGNTFLAEDVVKEIKRTPGRNFVLTSLRRSEDFLIPKKTFGNAVKMIVLESPQSVRYERLKARKRENYPKTLEEFRRQEERDFQIYDFGVTFSFADYKIENTETLEDLKAKIDKIMKEIMRD